MSCPITGHIHEVALLSSRSHGVPAEWKVSHETRVEAQEESVEGILQAQLTALQLLDKAHSYQRALKASYTLYLIGSRDAEHSWYLSPLSTFTRGHVLSNF